MREDQLAGNRPEHERNVQLAVHKPLTYHTYYLPDHELPLCPVPFSESPCRFCRIPMVRLRLSSCSSLYLCQSTFTHSLFCWSMWLACWPHMATLAVKKRVTHGVPITSHWGNPRGTIQLSPFGISSFVRVLLQGFNSILIGLGEHPLAAWSRGADCYFLWKFQFVSPKPQPNDTQLQSLDLVPLTHVLQTNDREGRAERLSILIISNIRGGVS